MIYPCMTCKQPRPCDREHCLAYQLMRQHRDEISKERKEAERTEKEAMRAEIRREKQFWRWNSK